MMMRAGKKLLFLPFPPSESTERTKQIKTKPFIYESTVLLTIGKFRERSDKSWNRKKFFFTEWNIKESRPSANQSRVMFSECTQDAVGTEGAIA